MSENFTAIKHVNQVTKGCIGVWFDYDYDYDYDYEHEHEHEWTNFVKPSNECLIRKR